MEVILKWRYIYVENISITDIWGQFLKKILSILGMLSRERQWLPRWLVNFSPFLGLRFFQKLDPGL